MMPGIGQFTIGESNTVKMTEPSLPNNRATPPPMPSVINAKEFPPLPRPQLHPSINENSRVHVLAPLFDEQLSRSDIAALKEYANELSLGDLAQSSTEQPLRWDVGYGSVSNLNLPTRRSHSGQFEWIGKESEALPTYLWDSQTAETVSATPEILNQGYIAVSWTWGRYQKISGGQGLTRKSRGTPWEVPLILPDTKHELLHRQYDLVHDLKACLASIPHRYFWVDIFCINQQEESEKQREIKKQANIFGSAQGVIAYLWTLNKPELLVDPIVGLGELLSWTVVFGIGRDRRDRLVNCRIGDSPRNRLSLLDRFDSLRDERWFTSLWALQEIVLAPAGVWMTRHGQFCHLNNHVLTTRKMAIIMRLLSWAAKRRKQVWLDAYQSYMKSKEWTKEDFERFLGKYKSRENKTKEELSQQVQARLRTYQSSHLSVPMSRSSSSSSNRGTSPSTSMIALPSLKGNSTNSSDGSGDQGIVVEIDKVREDPPWLIARYSEEALLRHEISKWRTWAFGGACIDVALTATRAGILVAGKNRNVVKGNSREEALFAALKVQPSDQFLSPATEQNRPHLSPFLINVILEAEGPKLFNVGHGNPRQSVTKSDRNDFDDTEWEEPDTQVDYILVEDVKMGTMITRKRDFPEMKAKYKQRGLKKFARMLPGHPSLLSDMFPDTASRMSPQILSFAWQELYSWAESDAWHMHAGALHIPEGSLVQQPPRRRQSRRFSTWVRLNGSEDEPYEIRSWTDIKLMCRTQYRLLSLLGNAVSDVPNFLFLPLGIRNRRRASHESWDCDSESLINEPGIIGVVLVTKSKDTSEPMTVWHKFGTYTTDDPISKSLNWGNDMVFQKLHWKDGILVSAFQEQASQKSDQHGIFDCRNHRHHLKEFFENFRRRSTDEPEYEIIHHHDVLQAQEVFPRVESPVSCYSKRPSGYS